MEIVFNNSWILLIIVSILNGFGLRSSFKKYAASNPSLKKGYDQIWKGWILYTNIPWVIMGIGNLSGFTKSVFDYFYPSALNPMVLIFHASIVILYILSVRWIYFKDGAEFLEGHPGFIKKSTLTGDSNVSAKQIKIVYPLMILVGIVSMFMMWFFPVKL